MTTPISPADLRWDLLPQHLQTVLHSPVAVLLDDDGPSVHHHACDDVIVDLEASPGTLAPSGFVKWEQRDCCWSRSSSGGSTLREELGTAALVVEASFAVTSSRRSGLVLGHFDELARSALADLLEAEPTAAPWAIALTEFLQAADSAFLKWERSSGLDVLRVAAAADSVGTEASWLVGSDSATERVAPRPMTFDELMCFDVEGPDLHDLLLPERADRIRSHVMRSYDVQHQRGQALQVLKPGYCDLVVNKAVQRLLEPYRTKVMDHDAFLVPRSLVGLGGDVRLLGTAILPQGAPLPADEAFLETLLVLLQEGAPPLTVFETAQAL